MDVNVIGIENVNYTKKDGTPVSGYNLHYTTPIDPSRGTGVAVAKEYVSASKVAGTLSLGKYRFNYGRTYDGRAYLASFEILK